jgi:hypothetical protein
MLIGAGVRHGGGPGRSLYTGASAVERNTYNQSGALRTAARGMGKLVGYPNGYEHPSTWLLPSKGGALATADRIVGAGDVSAANLAMGRALEAALTGAGDLSNPNLSLVVSMFADLDGDGSLTASLRGAVQLAASLAGTGNITAALGVIAFMQANLTGYGTVTGAFRGEASLAANIVSFGSLSPEGLAAAVWSAVAATNNSAGSMGEKLNDAGSGSNPWTEVIESGFTAAQIMRLLAAVAAGKTSIVDLGGGLAEVTIRDLADTKDRIVADMTGSERTTVTRDVT